MIQCKDTGKQVIQAEDILQGFWALYGTQCTVEPAANMTAEEQFLDPIRIPHLDLEDQLIFWSPIRTEEVWESITSMNSVISPAGDGLPVKFYKVEGV